MKNNVNTYNNKSGFKMPKNYMQDFESKLLDSLEINPSAQKGNSAGYRVPEDYFANFDERILAKIDTNKEKAKLISLFSRKRLYYATAVAAVFIVLISTVLLKTPNTNLDNMENVALEEYLYEESADLNYSEISNLLYEDGVIIESLNASSFSDEAIIEYLNENVEDSGLIIE